MDPPATDRNSSNKQREAKRPTSPDDQPRLPSPLPWLVLVGLALVGITLWIQSVPAGTVVPYSLFRQQLEYGKNGKANVRDIVFNNETLTGEWIDPPDDPKQAGKK